MSTITKVALAGATGNLGPAILDALLAADFQVTVLTRHTSHPQLPPSVTLKPVDYTSLASLTTALRGLDALVSSLSSTVQEPHLLLVAAAAAARIKRLLPSEFGSNTPHPRTGALPAFHPKIAVQDALKHQAEASGMTYTLLCTGPFLDWGLKVGFLMDLKRKRITLHDGGHRRFSTTSLPTIGRAVVGVLRNLEATRNRAVYVQDAALTQRELLAMGKAAVGGEGWTVEEVKVEEVLARAWEELGKEEPDPKVWVYGFIFGAIWGEGYGALFEGVDNELLGVEGMGEGEVRELVGRYA